MDKKPIEVGIKKIFESTLTPDVNLKIDILSFKSEIYDAGSKICFFWFTKCLENYLIVHYANGIHQLQ